MKSFDKKKVLILLETIVALLILACGLYVSDEYNADTEAIAAFQSDTDS